MLSHALQKLIRSLDTRKGRRKEGLFVAEGPRLVGELIGRFPLHTLLLTPDMSLAHPTWGGELVDADALRRTSLQQTPQGVLALFEIPHFETNPAEAALHHLCLMLDGVQDPGNLGTIVRVADWFGVEDIFCSISTCDIWNPKAIQATMGGIARVRVHYFILPQLLDSLPPDTPVYGTSLHGDALWKAPLTPNGFVVMGNEGNGLSPDVAMRCRRQLLIPQFPAGRCTTESLNVGMATGIVLAEFRRRCF